MEQNNSLFHGTGWSFPPDFSQGTGVGLVHGESDINESLEILLSTQPGERVMNADFGCDLTPLLYEPLTLTLQTMIKEIIEVAVLYHEPRIEVLDVTFEEVDEENGLILIDIEYKIRTTNSRYNLVYPFYKDEGAN
ncbi:GPW/gp25 family protein [Ekhidna sp.]